MENSTHATHNEQVPYAQIPNKLICDNRLSPAARWVAIYILSKSANWDVYVENIKNQSGEFESGKPRIGRSQVYSIFRELEKFGYAERGRHRDKSGKLGGSFIKIVGSPDVAEPDVAEPDVAEPDVAEEHTYERKTLTKDRELRKTDNNTGVSAQSGTFDLKNPEAYTEPPENQTKSKSGYTVEFSHVWENWGSSHKVRKKVAAKRFEAKPKRERAAISALVDASPWRRPADKIPALANWLRDEDVSEIADHIESGGRILPEATNKRRQSVQDDYMDMVAEIKETPADGSNFGTGVDIFA